jgi:hypothetical protein
LQRPPLKSSAGLPVAAAIFLAVLALQNSASGESTASLVADSPPSFRLEVMAVLSKAGCNKGTCHGNANGKGGFKLSLRGQDPDADFLTLTRSVSARRASYLRPESSLLLLKPLMTVPHLGGRRFKKDSAEYQLLRDWIAGGMPDDPANAPALINLNVSPEHATLHAPVISVELHATASFSDGSSRDVTQLAVFESSSLSVSIDSNAKATADQAGQTTVTARYLDQQTAVRLEFVPERPGFASTAPKPANVIDEAVFKQLERLKINPAPECDDTTFIRRAYLDLTGLLPTAKASREFAASTSPDKRARLIDALLDSSAFNDMQALRWADLLRVEEKTLDSKGVTVFHQWIRQSFVDRKPLNVFARELIEARGSTYKVAPTNFYRALRNPESRAEAVAQVFLGVRLQCAKCHNHPFDRWTQADYYGWSNYFARVDYEIVENKRRDKNDKHEFNGEQIVLIKSEGEVTNPATGQPAPLRLLGVQSGGASRTEVNERKEDRLRQLAHWMSATNNDRFAATQANRIWFHMFGRGIVDPVDDFRATNPPSNPDLLAVLQAEFVAHNYDVRQLIRLIANSHTYQLASETNSTNELDETLFSRSIPRRLTAEQTLDAIAQVLDVPVPFGDQKPGTKAVQLPGVRNGGHRYSPPEIGDRFLALFGKPNRLQSCDCERTDETTLAQTFELVSGELIQQLLSSDKGRLARDAVANSDDSAIIEELYWRALSRPPTSHEIAATIAHVSRQKSRSLGLEDVAWALLNSNEFLLRR